MSCKSNSCSGERLYTKTRFKTEVKTFSFSFVSFYVSPFPIHFTFAVVILHFLFFDCHWFSTLYFFFLFVCCLLSIYTSLFSLNCPRFLTLKSHSLYFSVLFILHSFFILPALLPNTHQSSSLFPRSSFSVIFSLLSNLHFLIPASSFVKPFYCTCIDINEIIFSCS